ncbi:MAG: hypothetical protein ACTH31_03860 [Pseudoclavibacter sp.]
MVTVIGESVVVYRDVQTGEDAHGEPIVETVSEDVDNVLVAPGPRADIPGAFRPDGVTVVWNLHFPKPYAADLRGARISVRGQDSLDVIGSPAPFTLENTPTKWWMPVEVSRADG